VTREIDKDIDNIAAHLLDDPGFGEFAAIPPVIRESLKIPGAVIEDSACVITKDFERPAVVAT
jgi:hypothetical protein